MMKSCIRLFFIASLINLATIMNALGKEPVIRLEGIKIKADNEAPQVMYIIPWQNPEGAERLYSPIRGASIERLKPLDPQTFELELELHNQWKASESNKLKN